MPPARHFNRWILQPPRAPGRAGVFVFERPTGTALLEHLRTEAELQAIGRSRFVGTLKQRNALWLSYRSFLRQAISNFRVALSVDNRSASLLYYYAMLNFAKAELLITRPAAVQGFVSHGLSFNVTNAKTIAGDSLTVRDGVFRLLFEERTGYSLPVGTRIPVTRLLTHIPEIGQQLGKVEAGKTDVHGLVHLIALDGAAAWTLLAVEPEFDMLASDATKRYFQRVFQPVDTPPDWRDRLGVSRRWRTMLFFESIATFPYAANNEGSATAATVRAADNTWEIKDLLEHSSSGMYDGWLTPSLYKTRMLPMPPSLARYAMAFYASSLVRYRPSMFDPQVAPEQAYLFRRRRARDCATHANRYVERAYPDGLSVRFR